MRQIHNNRVLVHLQRNFRAHPMEGLLQTFKRKNPYIIFEWNDDKTGARGWVVINSLRGGAAGGGTRMHENLDLPEVVTLAKIMEIKFTVSGPAIGGAKSGIRFNPHDPRKEEVLKRWLHAVTPLLKHYYGTGGDLNVDEVSEVIPITEHFGLWHPQEGIVNGHIHPPDNVKIKLLGQLRLGVSKKIEDPSFTPDLKKGCTIADMITGYGVARAVQHYYEIYHNERIEGKRVILQGWGNVAGSAGYYLAAAGAKIIAISDRYGGIINKEGYDFHAVRRLLLNRERNRLKSRYIIPSEEYNKMVWDLDADVFIPAAASRLVTREQVSRLIDKGLKLVVCGANAPFVEDDVFFGETTRYVDENISLIPDFIANCGMARTFAYLMQENIEVSDEKIFEDVSKTIGKALLETHARNDSKVNIARNALEIALHKLMTNDAGNAE